MHTFDGKSCRINFNSDMSGEIEIREKETNNMVKINGQDIMDFVANYIRDKKMSELEQANTNEIFKIKDDFN